MSILIADFADAFHSLGVHESDWPYLIAKHPVQGYVSYRTDTELCCVEVRDVGQNGRLAWTV
eukprot:2516276-Amphidinium_carterae.1